VTIRAGIFSDKRLYCGQGFPGLQRKRDAGPRRAGIPACVFILDDGTFAITDEEANTACTAYPGHTHILKVDKYSMPAGAECFPFPTAMPAMAGSRFIDLKFGEMQKADFAISRLHGGHRQ